MRILAILAALIMGAALLPAQVKAAETIKISDQGCTKEVPCTLQLYREALPPKATQCDQFAAPPYSRLDGSVGLRITEGASEWTAVDYAVVPGVAYCYVSIVTAGWENSPPSKPFKVTISADPGLPAPTIEEVNNANR